MQGASCTLHPSLPGPNLNISNTLLLLTAPRYNQGKVLYLSEVPVRIHAMVYSQPAYSIINGASLLASLSLRSTEPGDAFRRCSSSGVQGVPVAGWRVCRVYPVYREGYG